MQHEMWKVLCLLVGEGTIEQLVDSVVDGGENILESCASWCVVVN